MMRAARCAPGLRPRAFQRRRILVVGCGDVGQRILDLMPRTIQPMALVRRPDAANELRSQGWRIIAGDLDQPSHLKRLGTWIAHTVHLAPPPQTGPTDPRSTALLRALRRPISWRTSRKQVMFGTNSKPQVLKRPHNPRSLIYASTTGVYGDCHGEWVAETKIPQPASPRAVRRLHAETQWRQWGAASAVRCSILRIPGIYAWDRNPNPADRLQDPTPTLVPADDVWVNRIHATDLARALWRMHWLAAPQRCYNIRDDVMRKQSQDLDDLAQLLSRPLLPKVSWHKLCLTISSQRLSFLQESRRIVAQRIRQELGWHPLWPSLISSAQQHYFAHPPT